MVRTLELGQFEIEKSKPSTGSLKPRFRCGSVLLKNAVSVPIWITVTTLTEINNG